MSKKRDREHLERLNAAYDSLFPDIDAMSAVDVQRALDEFGVDREALRGQFHTAANRLAHQLRATGGSVPPYLSRALEQLSDARQLPKQPRRAFDKAKAFLSEALEAATSPGSFEIVGAYRGESGLSSRDRNTIDDLDADLRQRAQKQDEERED